MLACAKKYYSQDSNVEFNICCMSQDNPPTAGPMVSLEVKDAEI